MNPEGFVYCLDCGTELKVEHTAESQFIMGLSSVPQELGSLGSDWSKRGPRASPDPRSGQIPSTQNAASSPVALDPNDARASAGRVAATPKSAPAVPTAARPSPPALPSIPPGAVPPSSPNVSPAPGAAPKRPPDPPSFLRSALEVGTPKPQPAPKRAPGAGRIVVLDAQGREIDSRPITDGLIEVGRTEGAITFPDDRLLSDPHCAFNLRDGELYAIDLDSLNGVYKRLVGETPIVSGTIFRMGQQLLRFTAAHDLPGADLDLRDDGSLVWGSPADAVWGILTRLSNRGVEADRFELTENPTLLGRERGHITFPSDSFSSGQHARLRHDAGAFFLADLNSSNGTYLRVRGEERLRHRDLLLIGQKLFRIELAG